MEHVSGFILNCDDFDRLLNYSAGTGEHGVGVGKKEYLVDELGADTVELMNTIKRAVDPLNIMNPGKVSDRALEQATEV